MPTIQDPLFQIVTARLTAPGSTETFLDVGCCLGHVVRQLIAEGVSSERLYGTDLQPRFLDLGYELFRDRNRSKNRATFVAGDMLLENDARLEELTGKVDIIYASAFFHLFEREAQIKTAKRMVRFLRPENQKAMIFGRNEGPKIVGWEKYVLDAESWRRMWGEVGEATGTCWRTEMDVESTEQWIKVRFGVYRVT
jgi:ubiquinone/menaquinone biosynthesis C-methylase UbiE